MALKCESNRFELQTRLFDISGRSRSIFLLNTALVLSKNWIWDRGSAAEHLIYGDCGNFRTAIEPRFDIEPKVTFEPWPRRGCDSEMRHICHVDRKISRRYCPKMPEPVFLSEAQTQRDCKSWRLWQMCFRSNPRPGAVVHEDAHKFETLPIFDPCNQVA